MGLCSNCGLLGHESKVCLKLRQRDGEDSPYGDWLRAGFRKSNDITRHKSPSPLNRNMEENYCRHDRRPPPQPPNNSVSVSENPRANIDVHETVMETMDQQLAIFTDLCENEVIVPNPSRSNFENTVVVALKDDSPIDPDPVIIGDNLFSVPISGKQQSLDVTISLTTEILGDTDLNAFPHDQQQAVKPKKRKWRKLKHSEAISKPHVEHVAIRVGEKRRNKVEAHAKETIGLKKHFKVSDAISTSKTVEARS